MKATSEATSNTRSRSIFFEDRGGGSRQGSLLSDSDRLDFTINHYSHETLHNQDVTNMAFSRALTVKIATLTINDREWG